MIGRWQISAFTAFRSFNIILKCEYLYDMAFGDYLMTQATFTQFMLRQQSLKLYRDILRSLRQLENKEQANEIRQWARQDFECYKHLQDPVSLRRLVDLVDLTFTLFTSPIKYYLLIIGENRILRGRATVQNSFILEDHKFHQFDFELLHHIYKFSL